MSSSSFKYLLLISNIYIHLVFSCQNICYDILSAGNENVNITYKGKTVECIIGPD